ncbi:hypothetical protein QP028_08600 [Corynebacterium suedekumii]|nr:hypothetical protein QP028_08600 [Corynebacterium suedekumii]
MLVLVVVGTVALSQPGRLRSRIFWLLSPVLVAAMLSSVVRAAFVGLIVAVFVVGVIIHRRASHLRRHPPRGGRGGHPLRGGGRSAGRARRPVLLQQSRGPWRPLGGDAAADARPAVG